MFFFFPHKKNTEKNIIYTRIENTHTNNTQKLISKYESNLHQTESKKLKKKKKKKEDKILNKDNICSILQHSIKRN
jgi:hypothetical protein